VGDTRGWEAPWRPDRRTGRFAARSAEIRQRPGPHFGWPGPAIAAAIFQVVGAKDAAVYRLVDAVVYALLLIGPVALLWRRRAPVVVFAVAAAASIGFATIAAPRWTSAVAPAIALFTLAKLGRRTAALVCAAGAYVAYLLVTWVFADRLGVPLGARPDLRIALLLALGLALTIFLGGAAKARAEHMAEVMKARAERARAKQEQEKRQASEERLRIARELHDVLGHHLSLINVQAGVGLHLMDNRPEQAREALSAIKTASAEALREVRAVLGVLRTEDEAAPRQPALGLSRLDDLTADAGLPVVTKVSGDERELPPEVDRAAYRIVQEALTNVRRHAGSGATATVSVDYLPTALHLAVRNDVASGPAPVVGDGTGSGIAGMRARAESLGGSLEAGPVDGGYLVSVLLPAAPDAVPAPWAEGGERSAAPGSPDVGPRRAAAGSPDDGERPGVSPEASSPGAAASPGSKASPGTKASPEAAALPGSWPEAAASPGTKASSDAVGESG
jgi:signal transduction histidine kinase